MKILLFDNYDSFTYNLVHCLKQVSTADIEVHRNDKISLAEIERFDKIVLSPGPGLPSEAGILLDVIRHFSGKKPILGVCLGQQAIGEVFGGNLKQLKSVFHGVATPIEIVHNDLIFNGLSKNINVGRYHSWVVDAENFPEKNLEITATDADGNIMALRHRSHDTRGVQFHPESVLTPDGLKMLKNWVKN
jgi:anthranilate synthase component II